MQGWKGIHEAFYKDTPLEEVAKALGVKPKAAPTEPRSMLRVAGDVGISALKGAIGVPEAAVGLADIATGGRAGKLAEDIGFRPKDAKLMLDSGYSDQQKEAFRQVQAADGLGDTFMAAVRNPSVVAHSVVESLPSMGAGGVLARGGLALGARTVGQAAGGVGPALPGLLARAMGVRAAPVVAGALGEGVVGAGSAAEQIRQQSADGLLTGTQAGLAGATGALTTGFSMLGGKLAQKFGFADVDTMLAGAATYPAMRKGVVRSLLEGAVAEGILEELPQSVSEQVLQNIALDKPIEEGLDQAAVMGLLSGAAMGGGANVLSSFGGQPAGVTPVKPAGPLSRATTAIVPGTTESIASASQPAPAAPVDDPVLDTIQSLPDGVKQQAMRAYAVLNRPDVGKGVRAYNQKLLDGLLERVAEDAATGLENAQKEAPVIDGRAQAATEKIATQTEAVNPETGEITSAYAQRQADAPKQLPDDILNAQNKPFTNMGAAKKTAQALGDGFVPFKLGTNAFVVRAKSADQTEPVLVDVNGIKAADAIAGEAEKALAAGKTVTVAPAAGDGAASAEPNPDAKLPAGLALAKPRYSFGPKQFDLTFASDLDRAAYITAQDKPSLRDADYLKFAMTASGMTEAEVRAHGGVVRSSIKEQARSASEGGVLQVATLPRSATDAIRKKETGDVSSGPAIPAVAATANRSGAPEPGVSLGAGMGVGATAGPAVDAGRVPVQPVGNTVPLDPANKGAVDVKKPAPRATTQTQAAPDQAAEAGKSIETGATPAGAQAGAGGVETAGVDQRLVPVSKRTPETSSTASVSDDPKRWEYETEQRAKSPGKVVFSSGAYNVEFTPVEKSNPYGMDEFKAVNSNGKVIGTLSVGRDDGGTKGVIQVAPQSRRSGVASTLYREAEKTLDITFSPDVPHTQAAAAFWAQPNRAFGNKVEDQAATPPATVDTAASEAPNAAQQRADFAASEKARKVPGNAARTRANEANPFKAFLGKHGISNSLAAEFAPGRKERQSAMVQGYGPIFRKSGPHLDALAARAVEEGFLLEPDEAKLQNLILDALRGKRIIAQYAEGVAKPLYASRAVTNAADIIAWAKSQGFKQTLPADDMHVTVAYSSQPVDGSKAGPTKPTVTVQDGQRSVEPLGDGGAIVLKFASPEMQARWKQYRDAGASWDYEGYTPHVTLTYNGEGLDLSKITPYKGPINMGAEKQEALNEDKADEYVEEPTLTSPTPADVLAQQQARADGDKAETTAKTAADNRARADSELPDFTLTGSTRAADTDPNQIPMFSRAEKDNAPRVWRSALQDSIEGLSTNAAPAMGWQAAIKGLVNKGAAKADEVEWSGITDWLKLQSGKVSKEQVLDFLDGNGVKVTETVLGKPYEFSDVDSKRMYYLLNAPGGEWDGKGYSGGKPLTDVEQSELDTLKARHQAAVEESKPTKYSEYQVPGGTNYRVVLLTLPVTDRRITRMDELKSLPQTQENLDEYMRLSKETKGRTEGQYKSAHWDQPNVLAHIRVNDRTDADGNKVLFVEEIQSDWGQEGKKQGFNDITPTLQAEYDKLVERFRSVRTDAENTRVRELESLGANSSKQRIPSAPFVGKTDAWVSLALKRIIKMAADEGYDKVAFVNGEQSADRYDLSKQIDRVIWLDNSTGGIGLPKLDGEPARGTLEAYDLDGKRVINQFAIDPGEVENYVGKEVAKRLFETSPRASQRAGIGMRERALQGLELKVGGEGMKVFYDKIVPTVAKNVVRKLGGDGLRDVELASSGFMTGTFGGREAINGESWKASGFDITDAMREKAAEGMPLFSRSKAEAQAEAAALKTLSQTDELFALPKSDKLTVAEIAADNDPEITVKSSADMGMAVYTFTMPNGDKASMTVRPFNKYGESTYGFTKMDGELTDIVLGRPGDNPDDAGQKDDVWIDVSSLKTGGAGQKIYNIAATFAHNNGKVFIGDPAGLSDTAMRRRLENMISSALKFGTTEHLAPHPQQIKGDPAIGMPALQWVYGDDVGNIERMVDVSVRATDNVFPKAKNLSYDAITGTFKNSVSGRSVPFRELAGRVGNSLASSRAVAGSSAGASEAGWRTVARRAVFASLLEIQRETGGRDGLLAGLVSQRDQLSALSNFEGQRIFYSRGDTTASGADGVEAQRATAEVERIVQGITSRWASAPEVIVVYDLSDPRIPAKVRAQDLEQRSGGATGDPEGFFLGGKAYILASQVSAPKDVARVLFHESLGHFGLREHFGGGLKPILKQIAALRRGEVMAKAKAYGLDMTNEAQRLQAAEEVLAVMAQTRPEIGFVKRAIAIIRTWLRRNIPGFKNIALTDAEIIQNYILPARGFVERGRQAGRAGATPTLAFIRDTNEAVTNPKYVVGNNQGGRSADDISPGDFPRAMNIVDGLVVRDSIPNQSSISASLEDYTILPGVREIPFSAFTQMGELKYYSVSEERRTKQLAERIKESGEINPLIVVVDKEGPYVLEGGHRSDALRELGKTSFPALVVLDNDSLNEPTAPDSGGAFSRGKDQTDTPAFKRWFGASKVVDEAGKPLVVYHGTKAPFDTFDLDASSAGALGQGFYFAEQESAAQGFGDTVMPVYLDIKNPLVLSKLGEMERAEWNTLFEDDPVGARVRAIDLGYDGILDDVYTDREWVAFNPTQIKSAIGNNGDFDGANPDIRFSRSLPQALASAMNSAREVQLPAGYMVNDFFHGDGKLSWWHKSVGTQYNLAQRSAPFKKVFDGVQDFINDVSFYASEAADLAPSILPKLETWKDVLPKAIGGTANVMSAADNKAITAPIFEGTLTWMRDGAGKPVAASVMEAAAAKMTVDDKAQRLFREDKISQGVYKMWQGLPIEQYETLINNKYEREFLKPGIVFTPAELKSLFKLTDAQVALYGEFRAAVDKSLTDLAVADMVRYGGSDVAAVRDQALAMGDVDAAAALLRDHLMEQSTGSERAGVLLDTADTVVLKADRARDLMNRGYAPLSRFGSYSLDVVDENGERVYFGLFESKAEANRMARQMNGNFPAATIQQGTMSDEEYKLFAGVSPETLELFGEMLGLESGGEDAGNQVFQQYLKLAKANRSAMKRLIQRKGIAGFSEDPGRVLAGFVYSNARQTSSGLHMGNIAESVKDIPKGQGELKDAAVRLMDYVKNPQEEAQAIRGLLFAQYLGGSIASAMVNLMQPLNVTFPWLSQHGGVMKAAGQMKNAVVDALKKSTGDKALDAALKKAEEDGIVAPQEVFHLMAQAQGKATLKPGDGTAMGNAAARASNAWSKTTLAWGKVFGLAEQFNRRATFIAAYRTAIEQGMADPAAFAERAVNETQFVYNKGAKPRWARGAVGGVLFTFKSYSINYVELLSRMANSGPEGRKAALLALAVLFMMSGAGGLPFAEDIEDVVDGTMQRLGYNFSTKQAKQEFFTGLLGRPGADFVERGISGLAGVPIDVSGRLGMGNLLPGTGLLTKKVDHTRDMLELAGPAGDLAKRTFETAGKLVDGNILGRTGAAATMLPTAARNLIQANDMALTGMYRDRKGKKVIDVDGYDVLVKAIGFQPNDVARVQEATGQVYSMVGQNKLRESEIADMWAQGLFEADTAKVQRARDALKRWNENNPAAQIKIQMPQIIKRVKAMREDKATRIEKTAPKEIRATVRKELADQ